MKSYHAGSRVPRTGAYFETSLYGVITSPACYFFSVGNHFPKKEGAKYLYVP